MQHSWMTADTHVNVQRAPPFTRQGQTATTQIVK